MLVREILSNYKVAALIALYYYCIYVNSVVKTPSGWPFIRELTCFWVHPSSEL